MNTVDFLTKNGFSGNISDKAKLFKEFNKYGIRISYRENATSNSVRYIFSTTKKYRMMGRIDKYISECNGLVLESSSGKWSILASPIPTFKSKIPAKKVNNYIEQGLYDIFKIKDGTVINMYYYDNEWRISTSRGLEVNNVSPKNKTFQEIISEVCNKIGFDYKAFTNSLETKKSYSFGFKHPEMHPFYEGGSPIYEMWFVHSFDKDTGKLSYNNVFTDNGINSHELEDYTSVYPLFKKNMNSISYFLKRNEVNYGFILRSKDSSQTLDYSNILLESKLLQNIRKFKYSKKYSPGSIKGTFNNDKLNTLTAYLNTRVSRIYIKLFPEEKKNFIFLEKLTNELAKDVIKMSNKTEIHSNKELKLTSELIHNRVSNKMSNKLNYDDHLYTIKAFIRNVSNINLYYILYN